jgi:hypothetical protein
MPTFPDCVVEYRKQLGRDYIQVAYRGLMEFMMELKTHFSRIYPEYEVSSNLYPGYLDMTYFALVPPSLKNRKLKIAIVLVHETASFEVWLAAANRQVQVEYWGLVKDQDWGDFRLTPPGKGVDSILAYDLAINPSFDDLDALTKQIVDGTAKFICRVATFLSSEADRQPQTLPISPSGGRKV